MKTHKLFFLVFCFAIANLAFSQTTIQNVCLSPVDLHVNATTTNSAQLIWTTRGEASSWDIEIGKVGFEPGQGEYINKYTVRQSIISNSTNMEFTIKGLECGMTYDVYIKSNCGCGNISRWSRPVTFKTKSK